MNLKKLTDQILLFEADFVKELSLSFFRVQEFYESKNSNLLRKQFSVIEFLEESMSKEGLLDYFWMWEGYNIPGDVFLEWNNLFVYSELTPRERELRHNIINNTQRGIPFYVIGALKKDSRTIDHEIAHAFWYLDEEYQNDMNILNIELKLICPKQYKKIVKYLDKLGYNESVIEDEIQAYLSTERKKELQEPEDFGLEYTKEFERLVREYRKVLKKYKNKLLNK